MSKKPKSSGSPAPIPPPTDKPNILVIITDQHRHDLMTCAGRDLVPTPNIDRIAASGVRFTNAFCPYPLCVASRMSLLTGLYAHNTGAIDNRDRLDWRFRTMAHQFADNGYLTGLIGKMHFNDAQKHGFDYYLSINDWLLYLGPKTQHFANEIANHPLGPQFFNTMIDDGAGLPDVSNLWDGPSPWVGNVARHDFSHMASQLEPEDHLDSFIARETIKFFKRYEGQPFFFIASFMKPHTPFYAPKAWADRYPVDSMELPPVGDISTYPEFLQQRIKNSSSRPERGRRAHRAGYLGNLAFADVCVGRVFDAVNEMGLAGNTIIVYTSDHGEMDGDHGLFQKMSMFEPSIKVPLIVSYPKALPQNKVCDALIEYIGIYPTLLDLAGLDASVSTARVAMPDAPAQMDAESFADLVRDPSRPGPPAVFSEYGLRTKQPMFMIRTKRHKYILNYGATDELYDIESDPGEYANRINDPGLKKVAADLREQLIAWYDPEKNPYRPGGPKARKEEPWKDLAR